MAMRKSDCVTFCMHYCRYSRAWMNESCAFYPLHCLSRLTEWRDPQLVRNASFKGWAVWGSHYVISIVCHAHIACSKKILLLPQLLVIHFWSLLSSFVFCGGHARATSAYPRVRCTWGGKPGSSLQVTNMRKIYNYSTVCREDQTLLIPIGIFFVGSRNEYSC